MHTRKLSVALAALLLGSQFNSPISAAVTEEDLALLEVYVANEQVGELLLLVTANPELLELPGVLGDALRAFALDPSLAMLQQLALLDVGQLVIGLSPEAEAGSRLEEDDNSIY